MGEYPKRRRAELGLKIGKEKILVPIEISCRSNGVCVIKHPRMEDIVFPKKEKEEE